MLSTKLPATPTSEPVDTPSLTPEPTSTIAIQTPTSAVMTPVPTETASAEETITTDPEQPQPAATNTDVSPKKATLRVLEKSVNLRHGPGTIYKVVGYLFADEEAVIIARNQDGTWYNVLTSDAQGWVAASVTELLDTETSLESIEVAATIPVPPTFTPTVTPTYTPMPTPIPPRSGGGGGGSGGSGGGGDKPNPDPYPPPTDDPGPKPTENPYP